MAILDKFTFESVRSIAETLYLAHSAVLLRLHDSIGFNSFHLHWVPHMLTHDLREKLMEYAQAVLSVLIIAECDSWYDLVTDAQL
jgi:hypothetical protein